MRSQGAVLRDRYLRQSGGVCVCVVRRVGVGHLWCHLHVEDALAGRPKRPVARTGSMRVGGVKSSATRIGLAGGCGACGKRGARWVDETDGVLHDHDVAHPR